MHRQLNVPLHVWRNLTAKGKLILNYRPPYVYALVWTRKKVLRSIGSARFRRSRYVQWFSECCLYVVHYIYIYVYAKSSEFKFARLWKIRARLAHFHPFRVKYVSIYTQSNNKGLHINLWKLQIVRIIFTLRDAWPERILHIIPWIYVCEIIVHILSENIDSCHRKITFSYKVPYNYY